MQKEELSSEDFEHIEEYLDYMQCMERNKEDNNTCFGFVDGVEQELGYFTLSELESVKGLFGLKVELDRNFKPTKLSKIRASI